MRHAEALEWLQLVCAVGPFVSYVVLIGYRFVDERRASRKAGQHEEHEQGVTLKVAEGFEGADSDSLSFCFLQVWRLARWKGRCLCVRRVKRQCWTTGQRSGVTERY